MACTQGPKYCTYWLRAPATGVPYIPRTVGPQAISLHRNLTRRASGPGAIPCWKLFAPYLPTLVAVPRLIFIDSDLLLLESPRALWARVHPNPNPSLTPTPNPNPSSNGGDRRASTPGR